jgi:class 3 adenylate cyclase
MPELPSGAVTFLFTDIEGSTRLVKQLRDRYPEALHEHQRLLRAAFAAHRGHEVDTQGDSFFVAFAHARDAVLAAVEGQRALIGHEWADGAEMRVRMGIRTGQAVGSDGRYTGLAVHRAARIGAAAHGGQVLVSQATQTLLEDSTSFSATSASSASRTAVRGRLVAGTRQRAQRKKDARSEEGRRDDPPRPVCTGKSYRISIRSQKPASARFAMRWRRFSRPSATCGA